MSPIQALNDVESTRVTPLSEFCYLRYLKNYTMIVALLLLLVKE